MPVRVALTVLILFAANRASALAVCEDELSRDTDDVVEPAEQRERIILPCAVAERAMVAGDLACADATVYVVTHAGTLLCELDIPALVASTSPTIERAPAATMSSSAFSAAGHAPSLWSLVLPLVVELRGSRGVPLALPRDGFTRPPAVPS